MSLLVLLITLFVAAPTIVVILVAVSRTAYVAFPPHGLTLHWFAQISPDYWAALALSLELALAATGLALLLGVTAALALVRGRLPARRGLLAFLQSPLQVPAVVTGVAFLNYYVWLARAGGGLVRGSFLGLLLAHVVLTVPYVTGAVRTGLEALDPQLDLAAYGLGASPRRAFLSVTLPLLRPSLVAGAFFAFVTSFDNVPVSLLLGGGGTPPLPVALYDAAQFSLDPPLFAISAVVVVVCVVAVALVEHWVGLRAMGVGGGE